MFLIENNRISTQLSCCFALFEIVLVICLCVALTSTPADAQFLTSANPRFLSVYSLCESSNSLILPNGTCFPCNFSQYPNRVTFDSCINYETWPDDKMARDYGQRVDAGQSALLFLSTAAVCIMTFAIAFFYSGLSSDGNIMNTVLMTMMSMAITQLIWMLLAYSVAFGPGDQFWGKATWGSFANTVTRVPSGVYGQNVPHILFASYQGMFCSVTASVISGSVVCRFSFLAFALYVALWTVIVYAPLARWEWSLTLSDDTGEVIKNGWLARLGFLDTAGGLAVHTCGGWSALAASVMVGKRIVQSDAVPDVTRLLTSITLLWGFWFCFNGGGLGVTEIGTGAEALANTHISACSAMLVWMLSEYLYTGRASFIGAMTSAVVGLVAVTPSAGVIQFIPYSMVSGGVTSFFCFLMNVVKEKYLNEYIDDTLNVWIAHGLAGFFGLLFTGIFADDDFAGGVGKGGAVSGRAALIGYQLLGAVVGAVYSFVCTVAILAVLKYTITIRVDERAELMGLDEMHVSNQIAAYDNARAPKNEEEPFAVVICDVEKSSRLFAKDPWLMLRATEVTQKTILRLIEKYPSLYLVRREKKSRHQGKSSGGGGGGGGSGHHHRQRAGNGDGDGDDDDDDDDEGFSSFDTRVIVSTNAAEAVRFAIEIQTELNNINWGKRVAEKLDELYIRYISGEQESILKNSRKSFRKTTTAERFAFEQQKQLRKQPYVPYASSFNDDEDDDDDGQNHKHNNNKPNKGSPQSKRFDESGIFASDAQNDQDAQRSKNSNSNNNNRRPSATSTSTSSSSMNTRNVISPKNSDLDRKNNQHQEKTRRRDDDNEYDESSSRHHSRHSHRHHHKKVLQVKTSMNSQNNKFQQPPRRENSGSIPRREASLNSNVSLTSTPDSNAATSLYQSGASNQPAIVITGASSGSLTSRVSHTNLSNQNNNNNNRGSASSELHNNNNTEATNKTDDTCTNHTNNSEYTTSGGQSEAAMKSNNTTSGDINANINKDPNSNIPNTSRPTTSTTANKRSTENPLSTSTTTAITETLTSADKDRNIEIIKETSQYFNGIRLRVGVHYGRGLPRYNQDTQGYEYRGVVAQVASIIRRLGHGGQSLVSGIAWNQATQIDPQLKADTIPLNLGELELTKFRGSTTLFQVLPKELVQRKFPPLRSIVSDFGSSGGSGASRGSTLSYEESDESPKTSSSSSNSDRRSGGGSRKGDHDNKKNNSTTARRKNGNNNDDNNVSRKQNGNSSYKNNDFRERRENDEYDANRNNGRQNMSRSSNNSHHRRNDDNDEEDDEEEDDDDNYRRRGKSNMNNNQNQNKSRSNTSNNHHNSSRRRRYDDHDEEEDDEENETNNNNKASSNNRNKNFKEEYARSSSGVGGVGSISPHLNSKSNNSNNVETNNPLSPFASQSKKQPVTRSTSNLSKGMVFPQPNNDSSGGPHTSTSQQRQQRQQQQNNINHDSTLVLVAGGGNRGADGSFHQQMTFQNSEPLRSGVVPNNHIHDDDNSSHNLPKVVSVDDLMADAAGIHDKNPGGNRNRRTRGGGGNFKNIGVVPLHQHPHPLENSGLKSLELNNLGVMSRSDTGLGNGNNKNQPRSRFGKRGANNNNINNNNYSSIDEEVSFEAADFYGKNQVLPEKTKTDNNKNNNPQNNNKPDPSNAKSPGGWIDDYTEYSNGDHSEETNSSNTNNKNKNESNELKINVMKTRDDQNNNNNSNNNNNNENFPHTQQALNQQNQIESSNKNKKRNSPPQQPQQQQRGQVFSTTTKYRNVGNKPAEVIDLDDVESETDRNNIASSQIASSMQTKFVLHNIKGRRLMNNGNDGSSNLNLVGSSATSGIVDGGGGAEFSLHHVHDHGTPNGSQFSSSGVRQSTHGRVEKDLQQQRKGRKQNRKNSKNNGNDDDDDDDDDDDGKFGETHTSDEDQEDYYDYTKIRPEKEKTSRSSGHSSSRSRSRGRKSNSNRGRKKNQKYYSNQNDDVDEDMDEYGYKDEFVAANDFEKLRKQAKIKKQQNSPKYGRRNGNDNNNNNQKFVDEDDDDDDDYYRRQRQEKMKKKNNQNKYDFGEGMVDFQI